jgi:hypothetical protein
MQQHRDEMPLYVRRRPATGQGLLRAPGGGVTGDSQRDQVTPGDACGVTPHDGGGCQQVTGCSWAASKQVMYRVWAGQLGE